MISSNQKAMLDGDIDLKELDKLASSNSMIKSKQLSEMINIVRKCSQMFSFVSEAKVQLIAERLQSLGYGAYSTDKAIDRIINDYDKFPPFKVILELVKSYTDDEFKNNDQEYIALAKENRELLDIQAKFINVLGEEVLKKYVVWWIKNTFKDMDNSMLLNFGLCYDQFKKPALFDWYDAGCTKNFNRIIEVSEKKKDILDKQKNLNIKYKGRVKLS